MSPSPPAADRQPRLVILAGAVCLAASLATAVAVCAVGPLRIAGVPLASMALAAATAGLALLAVGLSEMLAGRQRARRVRDLGQAIAQSEEKLHEQHRLLDTALNNMSQGLVMFDAEARMVVCNRRYIEMYGLSPDVVKPGCTLTQLLEHRIAMGTFSGEPAEYVEMLRAAIAHGHTTDRTLELDDGRVIVVVNQPMSGGGWVATHEDITERRRAERELDRTRTLLNIVVENMPAMLVVKEAKEYRYVLINRAGEEL